MKRARRERILSIPFWLISLTVLVIIFDFGFNQSSLFQRILYDAYTVVMAVAAFMLGARYLLIRFRPGWKVWVTDALLLIALGLTVTVQFSTARWVDEHWPALGFLEHHGWSYFLLLATFFRELAHRNINVSRKHLNPAQLFILSFVAIVVFGTGLLLLPNATHEGIPLIDALFTSTSAVCVTGLIVVDTGSYFTLFGQTIILILIQMGGIGIMTFTSYFSHFFKGGSSFESQLMLSDMTSAQKVSEVFRMLKRIIFTTFLVELIGAALILVALPKASFETTTDRFFFSVFHAISGFCNAGFSTLSESFYDAGFRYNYLLHMEVALLFIFGGLGFPIVFNFVNYVKHAIRTRWLRIIARKDAFFIPERISVNSKIVLITTGILIVLGTVVLFCLEYNNTLAEHRLPGKVVTAFFSAVTPRTAGFNTVNTSALHFSSILMVLLLMWIGASPGSTGGGIKTSTVAIGVLNFLSIARGKNRIEAFRREITTVSVNRAFAIAFLSLIVIGLAVFLISMLDSEKHLMEIAFECFSAYSTVGLSLGATAKFSAGSKLVLIVTMFVGRVGTLTILVALLKKSRHRVYNYPTERILIN